MNGLRIDQDFIQYRQLYYKTSSKLWFYYNKHEVKIDS